MKMVKLIMNEGRGIEYWKSLVAPDVRYLERKSMLYI